MTVIALAIVIALGGAWVLIPTIAIQVLRDKTTDAFGKLIVSVALMILVAVTAISWQVIAHCPKGPQ